MGFVILKQLLPVMNDDENFQYIDKCTCIENDEIFYYETLVEAEEKIIQLQDDERYSGRNLKIIER